MDDERLEWALRRLPGVLACSLEGDTVTLLLDPHASAIDVEAGANALLLDAGDSRPPLVLGGTRPFVPAGRRRFDVVPVVKAAGPGLVAVGAAALVATLVASPAAFWRDAPSVPAPEGTGLAIEAPPALGGRIAGRTSAAAPDGAAPGAGVEAPAEAAPTRSLVLLVPELPAAPGLDASPAIVATAPDDGGTVTVQLAAASLPAGGGGPVAPAKAPAPVAPAPAPVQPSESAVNVGVKHKERAAKPRKAERRDDDRSDHEGERRNRGRAKASSRGGDDKDGCEG